MEQSKIKEIAIALNKAQGAYTPVLRNAENPFFKSKYATHDAIVEMLKEPFFKNGLSLIQSVALKENNKEYIETVVLHVSGEVLVSLYPLHYKDATAQGVAAGVTYAKRNGLALACGVPVSDDDDGNQASGPQVELQSMEKPQGPPPNRKQGCISDKQLGRLYGIAEKQGYTHAQVNEFILKTYHLNDPLDLAWKYYEAVVTQFSHPPIAPKIRQPIVESDIEFENFIA